MIVSASYRTDIPAFYGRWFLNRLDAGYCKVVNPYGGGVYRVSLEPDTTDGFVFWTKNLGPFVDALKVVDRRGYPFVVQYTINGYPRSLEYSVVNPRPSIDHMKMLAEVYGPRVGVWRYDTIVFSSATPIDFHRRTFEKLARSLEGVTDEVVVSFMQAYKKTRRNMNWAAKRFGFTWSDPSDEVKLNLAGELARTAQACGMQLTMCSQRQFLAAGVADARCVDARRLADVSGRPIDAKDKGHRPECGCYASRDIGAYDTCPHGCVYCYAVLNRELAQNRFKQHDPTSESLVRPSKVTETSQNHQLPHPAHHSQMRLF